MSRVQGYYNNTADLIEKHTGLVRKIAYHLMARLPSCVLVDDLLQSGMIGLLEAARNFDASKGASFETFSGIRIRGAMLDEIRRGDWVPRSVHRNSREISNAISAVENQKGGDAQEKDIAEKLGVTLNKYQQMLHDVNSAKLVAYEDLGQMDAFFCSTDVDVDQTFNSVSESEHTEQLMIMIQQLPEREALVLALYYDEELNLKEIGMVLELSESRVSQILTQALHRLKAKAKVV